MQKIIKGFHKTCRILEIITAALVLTGILLSMLCLFKDINLFYNLIHDLSAFRHYLEKVFILVIGIEFLEMLCRPNSDNVIQVLIFLVARHMIVGETTPYEDLVSVISITILCILRKYMHPKSN